MTVHTTIAPATCACLMCQTIDRLRSEIAGELSSMAARLDPELGPAKARQAVLAAVSLTFGDAILSWVDEDRQLGDFERMTATMREAMGGKPEGVTVQ